MGKVRVVDFRIYLCHRNIQYLITVSGFCQSIWKFLRKNSIIYIITVGSKNPWSFLGDRSLLCSHKVRSLQVGLLGRKVNFKFSNPVPSQFLGRRTGGGWINNQSCPQDCTSQWQTHSFEVSVQTDLHVMRWSIALGSPCPDTFLCLYWNFDSVELSWVLWTILWSHGP